MIITNLFFFFFFFFFPLDYPVGTFPIIVRCHSIGTESDVAFYEAKSGHSTGRPQIINPDEYPEALDSLHVASTVLAEYRRVTNTKHPHSHDRRLKELNLSLGVWILRFAGLAHPTVGDTSRYKVFRDLYNEYLNQIFTEGSEQMRDLKEWASCIRDEVMYHADIVFCTLCQAGVAKVNAQLDPHVIVVDEAGKASEPEMWAALAHFDPRAFIFVGDEYQLRPVITSQDQTNAFKRQLRQSLFGRLLSADVAHVTFDKQHRMEPRISSLVSKVFYGGALLDADNVKSMSHPNVKLVSDFNKSTFNIDSNSIMIDVLPGEAVVGLSSLSSSNPSNIMMAINLVLGLHRVAGVPLKDILILTAYQDQYLAYCTALSILEERSELPVDLVQVKKIDGFQGGEHSVVIVDLVATERAGFLRESNRLNVALSRARHACYVIGKTQMLEDSRSKRANRYLQQVVSFYKSQDPMAFYVQQLEPVNPFITRHDEFTPSALMADSTVVEDATTAWDADAAAGDTDDANAAGGISLSTAALAWNDQAYDSGAGGDNWY